MQRWTIAGPSEGRFRISRHACYCAFEYAVTPAPGSGRTRVALDPAASEASRRWFAAVERGISQGLERAHEGRTLVDVAVVLTRIDEHPVDTCASCCESHGRAFASEVLWRGARRVGAD